jgi:hypothetical protein
MPLVLYQTSPFKIYSSFSAIFSPFNPSQTAQNIKKAAVVLAAPE